MHLILTGATGHVGYGVLQHCLANSNVTRLSILSRREFALPTDPQYDTSKAQIIVHKDYASYPQDLIDKVSGAEGVVWAQGISQTEVAKDEYVRITFDYPINAAKAFAPINSGKPFKFVYVSGEGADTTEKSWTLFGKIKGRAERTLAELPSTDPAYAPLRVYSVRPGMVDPPEPHKSESLTKRVLGPVFRTLTPSMVSPTPELARVLVDLALGDGAPLKAAPGIEANGRTVRSKAIRTASWEAIFHGGRLQHTDL
ncbi:hypothetical protein BKA62DRAFT_375041 [Auriculariales sp. MPI-PUGE-AT-0066]|nr:hypothetical protein BKA62DRAFT_375041 [Auriculariales sp. MPI-PUGE-AT-0066]